MSRNMFSALVVVFSALLISASAADLSSEFAHHVVLDSKELMKLYWTVDWDEETIWFAVEAATTGWVGFGFSSGNGKMVGSDVVIGWVKNSKGYLTDRFADSNALPPLDKENNYVLTGFEESDQKTVLRFYRKFDTCDPRDSKIEQGTTKVVFAYHTEDPESEDDIKQHTYKGSRSILLLNNFDKKQVDETGWKYLIIQNKNVTIPKKETTYWCSLIKAPVIKTKHHITKFESYIQKGNEGLVHHFLIYECPGTFNESLYSTGFDCQATANMPLKGCYANGIVAAWAVGGEAFYYPSKAGYPIGTKESPGSYLLEIHYDNADGIEGRKDSSGVRFSYTSNLREYDAGVIAVGDSTPWLMIPPKQESWLSVGYCSNKCYQQKMKSTKLPEKGVKVFALLLHTHLQGRATWTKHIRNGIELPEVARDDHYDFNFQDIQILREEVHIKPGDDLIHYCKYETMDRDKLVSGGISTKDEMCLNFLFYYPKMVNISSYCTSFQHEPVNDFIKNHFPSLNVTSWWWNPLIGQNITWTDEMVSDFKKRLDEAKTFTPLCLPEGSTNYSVPIPVITKALPPPKSNCPPPISESGSMFITASRTVVYSVLIVSLMFL